MSPIYRVGLIGCGRMGATIDDEVKGGPNGPNAQRALSIAPDHY